MVFPVISDQRAVARKMQKLMSRSRTTSALGKRPTDVLFRRPHTSLLRAEDCRRPQNSSFFLFRARSTRWPGRRIASVMSFNTMRVLERCTAIVSSVALQRPPRSSSSSTTTTTTRCMHAAILSRGPAPAATRWQAIALCRPQLGVPLSRWCQRRACAEQLQSCRPYARPHARPHARTAHSFDARTDLVREPAALATSVRSDSASRRTRGGAR
jgi:hypothetical protein